MKKKTKLRNERETEKNTDDQPTDSVLVDDVELPDLGVDECEPTVPNLKVLKPGSSECSESAGFDPYDTAKLLKN